MTVCIMQPTYLPWSGYFNLIAQAKDFVFLDDVQFSHQSWQQRNRIVLEGQPHILTVPVHITGHSGQLIDQIEVDGSRNWRKKHLGTLRQAYGKHPYGPAAVALVEEVLARGQSRLVELNIDLITAFCGAMGLQPKFYRSSALHVMGARSDRLLAICRYFGGDTYLSPVGSKAYLEEDAAFVGSGVEVVYQEFGLQPYPQRGAEQFISHMSVLDLLANVGFEEGRKYVEQNNGCRHGIA